MADTEKKKPKQVKSPMVGTRTKAVTLSDTTKLDIDTKKTLADNIIEASINGGLNGSELDKFTSVSNARDQIYQLIDTMCQDSSVTSIVRTYAEDVTETADNGHIMWCESNDANISKFVNYLLNTMNVDKNIYGWAYNLVKYGDIYLRLYRESDYNDAIFDRSHIDNAYSARNVLNEEVKTEALNLSLHKSSDLYSYYVEMVPDPSTMFELTRYGKTYGYVETPNAPLNYDVTDIYAGITGTSQNTYNYRMKSNDIFVHQADDFVHATLEDGQSRFPETVEIFTTDDSYKSQTGGYTYNVRRGKSMLYDSYKIWREKSLLENSVLLNRITKSSIVRTIQVEVGDMPKTQVQNTLRRLKELMEQKSSINTGKAMSEYTNTAPIENNIYLATHGGQGAVTIGSIGGDVDVKNLADLDNWNNKFYAAYGVPKQYFGYCLCGGTEILLLDGTTHTIEELYNNRGSYIGKGIMGCNQDGSLCPTKITNIMLTNPKATYLRIWLDNNTHVDVTPDHKMMLRDGTFIEASKLVEGDSLMPYYDKIKDGRRYVLDNKLGKLVPQYHIVSAAKGEPAEVGYNIHHKDKIKINDDFDNLIKLTVEEHCKVHNFDLAAMHKLANEKRLADGKAINANVGGKFITNGKYYTTLKDGEAMPDGFWYEGPKKSDETKAKMKTARLKVLADHPEYANLGGFKAGEAKPETIAKMKAGQAEYWANMTDEERDARRALSRKNGKANIAAMQAARMQKMASEKPDAIRKPRKLRCPVCDKIFELNLNNKEYSRYLNTEQLFFCCPEHRNSLDAGGKLARSYQLYLNSNCNEEEYEYNRTHNDSRPDTFLKFSSLSPKLSTLNGYVPEVNHKVVKIDYINEEVPVYDITVADNCHTFALACGIFVHNCDDAAGFNGGSSLTIISSVYAKGVKRIQNALIQMVTDAVSLFLVNRGYKSYLNNFTIKMKAPMTQEEKDYREDFTSRISAISNFQSLLADVEDKGRRLTILKNLIRTLNYDEDIINELQQEIDAVEEQKRKDAEAAEQEAEAAEAESETEAQPAEEQAEPETVSEAEPAAMEASGTADIDLGNSSQAPIAQESFGTDTNKTVLTEDQIITENDDLPTPEEANANVDFTQNK